jgi:type 1 glutamine amidotransferase
MCNRSHRAQFRTVHSVATEPDASGLARIKIIGALLLSFSLWDGCGTGAGTASSGAKDGGGDLGASASDLTEAGGAADRFGNGADVGLADAGNRDGAADALAPDLSPSDGARSDAITSDVSTPDASGPDVATASLDGVSGDSAVDAAPPEGGGRDVIPAADATPDDGAPPAPFRVLLFSRTAGFRHDSIPTALATLMDLQTMGGYTAEATEDPAAFTTANLARFRVVVFASTTGDVLDAAQQTAFEAWINGGGGYVGIHSASDTEYDWPFYGELVGAYFRIHPAIQMATIHVEATSHPIMAGVPITWARRDEWYDFVTNPRPNVTVLATLDESTYAGGTMGADHPIAWAHATAGGGRSFYTALGHTPESYAEVAFRRHLVNGLRWVAGR